MAKKLKTSMSSSGRKRFNTETDLTWKSSHPTRQDKRFHSFPKDVRSYTNVGREEDTVASHHNASGPTHQAANTNEHGQWKEPGSGRSLLTMVDRPACSDTHNINIEKALLAFQKPAESLPTFQNLIESSWMSASLHRSILALGGEEVVTPAKARASDFSMSALLLYSPRISLPVGRSQHNSLPLGGLMHAQPERELQLTKSHKMFQPANVPGVLPQENNMGHAKLFTSQLPAPTCSTWPSSEMELHARRPVGAHELALDRQVNKTNMAQCASHLERPGMKENVSQMDPEGNRTFRKKSCSRKEPRQANTPGRSNENQIGQAGRRTERWHLDWHRRQISKEPSTNRTFQASSRPGGSSSTPRPTGGPTKRDLLSSVNQLHAAPQIFFSAADEEIAERFQALYRFRLLLRCFRRWCAGFSSLTKARLYQQRRILSRALCALQQAVLLQRAQADTAVRRQNALLLAQAFHKWKDCCERRRLARLNPDSCTEDHIVALRRRLVKSSESQPLRITYSAWRSHIQGQPIHRAAVIHHHLAVLWKHWLLWRLAWIDESSRSRQQQQQAYVWRGERLRSRAWTTWLYVWQKRQQTAHLHRLVLQRCHQCTQTAQLMRLTQTAEQVLSIRTLSATFRRWKQAKKMREATQSLRHLQDKGKLQGAFEVWLYSLRERMRERKIQERRKMTSLARFFSEWRRLFQHRTRLVLFSRQQHIYTARIFFKQWRRALELRLLLKHVLILFFKKQQMSQQTSAVQGNTMAVTVDLNGQDSAAFCSAEELWTRLVLQAAFCTWKERLNKQRLARWHHTAHVREKVRSELLKWHRFTQAELSDRVLCFRARLAQYHPHHSAGLLNSSGLDHSLDYTDPTGQQVALKHCANSSGSDACLKLSACCMVNVPVREQHCPLQASPLLDKQITRGWETEASRDVGFLFCPHQSCSDHCSGEAIAVRVLIRMMQPDLSLAFSQWRAVLRSSRQKKWQANLFTNSRRLVGLKLAFSTWKAHREMQHKAVQRRERVLLSSSLSCWKRLTWGRHTEHCLQQQATHLHQTTLIKHCFTAWHTQAVSMLNSGQERVEQRVERRRLSWAFTTWTARVRQQNCVRAFCTHTMLRKVFVAWQKCVQYHKERQAAALSFVQHRLCSAAFSQWRSSWTRQQLASSKAIYTLRHSAKHMLQCWREYTHNRCRMHVHLSAFIEERERTSKRRAFHVWQQAVENAQRAQQFYQRVLLCRCYSKWLCVSEQNIRLRCVSHELQQLQVHRLQQSTFSLWKRRFLHIRSQKQRLRTLISRWTATSRLHRAARQRDQRLLTSSLQQWSRKLDIKRKRRETARLALRIWRQNVSQGREDKERVQNVQKLQLTHTFVYWTRAVALSIKSREHHAQKQRRRLLLAWHMHTVSAQRMRYTEACFQYDIELRVMGSCFGVWRKVLIQTQNRQCVLEDCLKLHHRRLTSKTFKHWKAATTQRSAAKKIKTALLRKWYVCWMQRGDALRTANQFHDQRQREAARLVLTSWSSWAKAHKVCRQMEEAVRLWLEGRQVCTSFQQWVKVYRQHQVACLHSQIHLLHRSFCTWKAAVVETHQKCQTADLQRWRFQIQSAFRTWRWAATSHKAVQSLAQWVRVAHRKRLLRAAFQAWHHEAKARRQRDLHLSEKFFSLWVQEVQRRQSDRLLQARWRAKWLRRWRYRAVERREQGELTRLHWASWKSQTAASLLYSQQYERKVLQRAWLTWRKRRIRNKVVAAYGVSLNRYLLLKAFRLWWQRTLVSGAPTRPYSL